MTRFDCSCLHDASVSPITLLHDDSDARVTVCVSALRSMARLKADAHDRSGEHMLAEYGREYGWGVWRSQHILYLIPPVTPFDSSPQPHPFEATLAAGTDTRP